MPKRQETFGCALITGASSGIGAALARALTARAVSPSEPARSDAAASAPAPAPRALILTGRSRDRLDALAAELTSAAAAAALARPLRVEVFPADLGDSGAPESLADFIAARDLEVDLLINNAGLGLGGEFAAQPAERVREMLAVNIEALVALTHRLLPPMLARGRGAVVNVASVAGFQPVPHLALYAATKAFGLDFSLALWEEARKSGVHVMAVCPGTTRTAFFARAKMSPRGYSQSPERVAELTLRGLDRRRALVVCGWPNRLAVAAERFLPRLWLTCQAGALMRRR